MRRAVLSSLIVLAAVTATAPPAHSEANQPSTSSRGDHRPIPGCGTAPSVEPGTTASRTIESGGREREYLVHVPENYRPDRPTPVVLSFHGHKRTAAYQEELTGFSEVNAISVYPQGLVGTDGKTAWEGAPYAAGADDVQFADDLLDDVQGGLCVDPARIYASGKSNGGGFTETLACRRGDRIAAFAPVSGARYPQGGECAPAEPVPMVFFHGKADNKIPYDGDPARGLPAIPDWLGEWSGHDRCRPEPVTTRPLPEVARQNWVGCDDRGALAHYAVEGLGHDWPSRSPNPDSEKPTAIDATPIIWEFFQRHPLTT